MSKNLDYDLSPKASSDTRQLLHDFFEHSAYLYPEAVAIDVPPWDGAPRKTLTYKECNTLANALAESLRSKAGDEGEHIIAILLPRTDERLYIAQLAVMKSGGAYLCLDPSFPAERLRFTIEDAAPRSLITDEAFQGPLADAGIEANIIMDYDTWFKNADLDGLAARFQAPSINPERLAYVIYTSGTTGQPKGVMVEHQNVATLLLENSTYFDLGPDDRVIQNSSSAYDSSIEETYLAFAFGGTLVVGRDEVIRLGPDLGDWLAEEQISVFCPPPTLLRTIGGHEASQRLTSLNLLYVGGEAVAPDVVKDWADGRRLENGYGPTECAITITRTPLFSTDSEVTIGRVIPDNQAWVLDEESRVITDERQGELCISGPSVSRGYLNRPELTTDRFPTHPDCGRIYRTGDLVSWRADGHLRFHGRIDTQVKLRGYRIELADIETHLCALPNVLAAACTVQGTSALQQLVAFIVESEPDTIDTNQVRDALAASLPPYMVPARFEIIDKMPTSASGKLDRKALPTTQTEILRDTEFVLPRTPTEALIAQVVGEHLGLQNHVSIDDDFFVIGGDSLSAAVVISALREHANTAPLAMRDMYECRTVRRLAEGLETRQTQTKYATRSQVAPAKYPALTNTLMLAWVAIAGLFGISIGYLIGFKLLPYLLARLDIYTLVIGVPILLSLVGLIWLPISVLCAVAAKRIIMGRYEVGRHPVWGLYYVKNWLVQRFVRLIPWGLIAGTEFQCMVLRLLGARIGRGVHIHKGVNLLSGGWDLLTIGDNVTLGRDAALRLVDYVDKDLLLDTITLGEGATLETRAGVSGGGMVGVNGYVTALSCVGSKVAVPDGMRWHGVPGVVSGPAPEDLSVEQDKERQFTPVIHGLLFILYGRLIGLIGALPFLAAGLFLIFGFGITTSVVNEWLYASNSLWSIETLALLGVAVAGIVLQLPILALTVRLLGRVKPGTYPRLGKTLMVIWYKDSLVTQANRWLSGTLFWPTWLRWAGMKVGPDSEISTIMEVVPELITIEGSCFFADGIYLGGARIHRGAYSIDTLSLSTGTFLGNHALIHGGSHLPPDILLGICTVAEPTEIKPGTSWFGHPSFQLPRRQIVQCDRSLTHSPAWYRYLNRLMWELGRFLLPTLPIFILLAWFKCLELFSQNVSPPMLYGVIIPLYSLAFLLIAPALIILLKWGLLGRGRAGQHPLWSCWCCRWDFLYVAWGMWARPLAQRLEGTLATNAWLRLFGVGIGRGVFLGPGFAQVVDPDMLNFEANSTVVNLFQAHSFEDRVLKKAPVHIRENATVRAGVVMLYGADIGQGAIVTEQSVIMKNELLLPDRYYCGAPTQS